MEEVDDGPHDEAEIVELGKVLFANVAVVYRAFDWYASADPNSNIRSIGYNAYKAFIDDCALDIPGSRYCDTAHFDQLFIKINAMVVGGGRKLKDDVDVSSALVGRQGMATDIAGRNDDKRALSRHEWLNVLVRIAIMRYVKQRKQEQDASRALARLIDDDLLPRLDPWVTTDHQLVRQRVCYTEEVDDVLALHAMNLELLFKTFADTEGEHTRFKTLRKLLSLSEWLAMMRVLELYDEYFSARDATIIFVLSRMRVVDEEAKSANAKLENLSLEDFYEALCRVALLKALPTDEEIVNAGCADAGDFVLEKKQMNADRKLSDYEAWVVAWHARCAKEPIVKASQPPERCLDHLITLMLRTVKRIAHAGEGGTSGAQQPRRTPDEPLRLLTAREMNFVVKVMV